MMQVQGPMNNGVLVGVSHSVRSHFRDHQPTVRAWFDGANHERVWGAAPGYLGTTNAVSLPGAYYLSPNFGKEKVLIRGFDGNIFLRDNICTHRQALLLTDEMGVLRKHDKHGSITLCPIHKWGFSEKGNVVGEPNGFHECKKDALGMEPVVDWSGFLFTDKTLPHRLSTFGASGNFDPNLFNMSRFHDYVEVRHYDTPYSGLIFDYNYLDCYHVAPFHPETFGQVADVSTLKWEMGDGYAVQTVWNLPQEKFPQRDDISWARLTSMLYDMLPDAKNHPFAVWAQIYPGIMPELYCGHLLAMSYIVPLGPKHCVNVVEYYMSKEAYAVLGDGFMDEFIKTYRTSADEDDDICIKIQQGWNLLAERNARTYGPFHNPLEDGMMHYLSWLQTKRFDFNIGEAQSKAA